ncbi:MAG TPA: tripartite tricarboxylate transporter substrate binding protein [Burkholderiales bacterium]|nr:tripartite tricarboxylate transporter substrate binding protein [Burkholderiales bacterium]
MRCSKLVLAAVLLSTIAGAHAGEARYPTRPVRLVVPFAAGGPSDIIGRLIAQKLTDALGQPVIVDNRGSAGGIVGFEIAAKAVPDGYTLLLGGGSGLTQNPSLYLKLPYDGLRDFAPITQLTAGPNLLSVHPSVPAKSVADLIALAKAKPGQINFASAGTGNRLSSELFKISAGIDIVNVPYKGTGQAITDLVGGQVQMMMINMIAALPQVKSGKLRGLAVTSLKRSSVLPEVPTVAESLPGFEVTSWHAFFAPAKTPPAIITRLHGEAVKILKLPDVHERFVSQGLEPVGSTPQELAAYIKSETVKYAKLIKQVGIKPE